MTEDIEKRRPKTTDSDLEQIEWRRTRNRLAQRKCRNQRRQRDERLQSQQAMSPTSLTNLQRTTEPTGRPGSVTKPPVSHDMAVEAHAAGGRDELSGGSRRSSQQSVAATVATMQQNLGQASFEEGAVARLASLVKVSQTLGFPTLDAAIKAYYTEDLSGGVDSSTADRADLVQGQRDSRRRHLRSLLVALQHSVKSWSPDESRGLREEAARIAESVYATELKLLRDDPRFTTALSAVLAAIHNLQDLLIAHFPPQSRDEVSELSSLIDTLAIRLT